MKGNKIIMLCAALAATICSFNSLSAQTFRDERKVPEEQVPISIRNTFQEEFNVTDDTKGAWYIFYKQQNIDNKSVVTPLSYIYRAKKQGEKIEIKYDPAGKLESAKGLLKKDTQTPGSN